MLIINGPETDSNEPYKRQYVVELDMESSAIWVEDTTDLGITVRCSLNDHEFLVPVKVKLYGQPPRGILSSKSAVITYEKI